MIAQKIIDQQLFRKNKKTYLLMFISFEKTNVHKKFWLDKKPSSFARWFIAKTMNSSGSIELVFFLIELNLLVFLLNFQSKPSSSISLKVSRLAKKKKIKKNGLIVHNNYFHNIALFFSSPNLSRNELKSLFNAKEERSATLFWTPSKSASPRPKMHPRDLPPLSFLRHSSSER